MIRLRFWRRGRRPLERLDPFTPKVDAIWRERARLRYGWASTFCSDKTGPVLDLCCGTGWGRDILRGTMVIGVDRFHQKGADDVDVMGNSLSIPFRDGVFEHVVILAALEHFTRIELEAVFMEIKRVLAPAGTLTAAVNVRARSSRSRVNPHHPSELSYRSWDREIRKYFPLVKWHIVEGTLGYFRAGTTEDASNPELLSYKEDWERFSPALFCLSGLKRSLIESGQWLFRFICALFRC